MTVARWAFLLAAFLLAPLAAKAQASETGTASWYGPDFNGKRTANGEVYDKERLTAAHRTLPFGTYLRVRSLDNGSSVVVRVNDRGPFAKDRVIDLSEAAARVIGMIPTGTARVELTPIPREEALAWRGGALDGEPGGADVESASPNAQGQRAAPAPGSRGGGTRYRVQVASYASEANAKGTLERLAMSGLVASIERSGSHFRVVLADLSPADSRRVTQKLDGLGYRGYSVTAITPSVAP
jgi:rare lipoprotein A